MFKKIIIGLRGKYYPIPILYSLIFGVLAIGVLLLENNFAANSTRFIPDLLYIEGELGEKIIILTIGSMLTILTISISIIMIVLTLYGNHISPRTVQDFLEKKTSLRIIGYYIGVLLFCLISLFGIKIWEIEFLILSPTLCILMFIIAIILFIYFMHFVSKSIQVNVYIQSLTQEAFDIINKKQVQIDEDPNLFIGKSEDYENSMKSKVLEVIQDEAAFIQYFNEKKLLEIAKKHDLLILCEKKAGEHVTSGEQVAKIYYKNASEDITKIIDLVRKEIVIGTEPNLVDNLYSETGKLVEIAVRALSPGINDPVTAITCIESIGTLLQKAVIASESKIYKDERGVLRLILEGVTFNKLLFEHFYQIKYYGSGDLKIIGSILTALNYISQNCTNSLKEQIWGFSEFLISDLHIDHLSEIEKRYIYERLYQLSVATNCNDCLNEVFKKQ